MSQILGLYNYWVVIVLMMIGFYVVLAHGNLVKKVIGLSMFQVSVFLLYITMGKVEGGTTPIRPAKNFYTGEDFEKFTTPLPSVLMLTAIVVGVATTSLALALIVRIREAYGTIEEDEILAADQEVEC